MKTVILIPARYASTRYPGKPLALLAQTDGTTKTLIQMSWEAAMAVAASTRSMSPPTTTASARPRGASAPQVVMTSRGLRERHRALRRRAGAAGSRPIWSSTCRATRR